MDRLATAACTGPMVTWLRGTALILAVLSTGVMAGIYQLYSHTVMPGLGRTDDRTFVGAFQAMDRAILNPPFLAVFLGGLVCTALAAALSLGGDRRLLPWLIAALVLHLVAFVVTVAVNVPLNDALKAAGNPADGIDVSAARAAFDEARWVRWNLVRTVTCTAAFGCLVWTVFLFGRLHPSSGK